MSLLEKFRDMDPKKVTYYNGIDWQFPDKISNLEGFCRNFIYTHFNHGAKENVFRIDFHNDFFRKGKHIHTVVLYYLGIYLKDIISDNLKHYLKHNINEGISKWFDFIYTWFLSCLYHDTASVLEDNPVPIHSKDYFKQLDYYLGKHAIRHDVYDHSFLKKETDVFTFPKELVKNYFFYRADCCHCVDHGIIGGFLLYDRLFANYNKAWEEASEEHPPVNYDCFKHRDLKWRIEHLDHFAIIADSIIAHNIWYSSDGQLYKQYGLDTLIIPNAKRINMKEKPLLFFLSLMDTIEPTKRFPDRHALEVLKAFEIIFEHDTNKLSITRLTDIDSKKYFDVLESSETWLDISIERINDEKIKISINS